MIRLNRLKQLNEVIVLNIVLSLKSVLQVILMYLCHHTFIFNSAYIYDLVIIMAQFQMYLKNQELYEVIFFDDFLLKYYRYLQMISVTVIMLLYLRLIGTMIVFKSVGIYLIILEKIVKKISYFLLYFFVLMTIIGICSYMLFKNNDPSSSTIPFSIFTTFSLSLGNIKLHHPDSWDEHPD